MKTDYRIAQLSDLEEVYQFAENQLRKSIPDEMELMIQVWNSRFRKEALDHYLKNGWSFVATQENKIAGYFLGQPFLFFEGQTQTLWVDDFQSLDLEVESQLVEIAYKLARDKHLQRVILPKKALNLKFEKPLPFQKWSDDYVWLKTTK